MATEISKLHKTITKKGWDTSRTSNGHYRHLCPCGKHILFTPSTPRGGKRSIANARAKFRQLQGQCDT